MKARNLLVSVMMMITIIVSITIITGCATTEEKAAIEAAKELKKHMLAPDSINLFQVLVATNGTEGDGSYDYIAYITFSAMNKAGGFSEGKAVVEKKMVPEQEVSVYIHREGASDLDSQWAGIVVMTTEIAIKQNPEAFVAVDVDKIKKKIK